MADNIMMEYRNRLNYPNKFLNLGSTYLPKDVKELINLCRIFYYSSPLIRNIVDKLAEYPITDLILTVDDKDVNHPEEVKNKVEDILNVNLNIKRRMMEYGINYNVNGSVVVSVNLDFTRMFQCSSCEAIIDPEESSDYKVKADQKKIRVVGSCPKCNSGNIIFKLVDIPINSPSAINLILWNPLELDVDYNEWNGKKRFLYTVPKATKNRFLSASKKKDNHFILTIPAVYIDAMEQDKSIELDAYHLGTPELAQDKRGLNVPVVVSVLKDYWYYQTMRRAQESILSEHVVPFRSVFPQPTGSLDPFTMMRMDKWKSFIKEQIEEWKKDHNHIMITPIPVGSANIGGDAKYLMMTNELRLIEEDIITGFGAPVELIKGGVSWSGTSISLRILENHFLSFRKDLEIMMNTFILPKISKLLKLPKVTVRFSRLRMSDDQQFKALLFQLVEGGYLGLSTLLEELGFNPGKEKEIVMSEADWFNTLKERRLIGEATTQGKQQVVLSKYQMKSQEASMFEQALIKLRQEQAANGSSVNPDILQLAQQFMNLKDEQARKEFLKIMLEQWGEETVKQLVMYLKQYSSTPANEQEAEDARDQVDKQSTHKNTSPPAGKSRKPERSEERVKGGRRNA